VYENRPINSANHMLPAHVNSADLVRPTAPSLISSTISHPLPQQLPSTLTMPDPTNHTGLLMYFRGILEAHEEDYRGAPVGDDRDAVVKEIVQEIQVMATENSKVISEDKALREVCL
jgi:hypothetical protein